MAYKVLARQDGYLWLTMPDHPQCSPLMSLWTALASNPQLFQAAVVVTALTVVFLILRRIFPSRMMASLYISLHEAERIYHETFESHGFGLVATTPDDADLASRLILYVFPLQHHSLSSSKHRLQDEAANLHIRTLRSSTSPMCCWWSELPALFNGHLFALWRCRWKIAVLTNDLQASSLCSNVPRLLTKILIAEEAGEALSIEHGNCGRDFRSLAVVYAPQTFQ